MGERGAMGENQYKVRSNRNNTFQSDTPAGSGRLANDKYYDPKTDRSCRFLGS